MASKQPNIQQVFWRTLAHFITPRLRLYMARLLFTAANKPIHKGESTSHLEKKMMVLICDCFTDPNFLEYLRAQATLMRTQILNEHHHTVISLPEEQEVIYQGITHFMAAKGIPLMVASPYEVQSLGLEEGSVRQ
jgi:hypothetical protein